MRLAVPLYMMLATGIALESLFDGEFSQSAGIWVGSLLATASGAGLRTSRNQGNGASAFVVSFLLAAAGFALLEWASPFGEAWVVFFWVAIGWFCGLLWEDYDGNSSVSAGVRSEIPPDPMDAVADLGELMERYPDTVFPEAKLPLPMDDMKAAFRAAWLGTDDAYLRSAIHAGYSHLAYFRSDIVKPYSHLAYCQNDLSQISDTKVAMASLETTINNLALMDQVNAGANALDWEFRDFISSQS